MAILEEKLAKVKEDTRETNDKIADLSKNSEEHIRQARVLKNATTTEDEKQAILEAEHARIVAVEKESSQKYDEVSKKILSIEVRLEEVESKARKHEKEKLILEEELRILTNNLKSLECAKDKSCKKEEVLGDKVKIMMSKSKEMESRADLAEKAAEKLQDEVEQLQENLRETKVKNDKAEEEMETLFQDLRNL